MPGFMEYLTAVKIAPDWTHAAIDTLSSAKNLYKAAGERDLIVIGNIDKEYKFDKIFNFQDIEEDLPYEDKFLEKVRELVKDDLLLSKFFGNLYTKDDSVLALHNCLATADFIAHYMETDPHLEIIEAEYQKKKQELEKKYGTTIH